MGLRKLARLFKIAAIDWYNDNTFRLSASLAFYTIFSMAPVLLISVSVASLWFGERAASRQLIDQIESIVGPDGARAAQELLARARAGQPSLGAALAGLAALVVGSTAVFAELHSALNQIWDVQASPSRHMIGGLLRDRLVSFVIVLGVGLLLLISLILSALLSALQDVIAGRLGSLPVVWRALNLASAFFITILLFAMIYKFLPDVEIKWRHVFVGSIVTSILFTLGTNLIGIYIGRMAFASRYGAAGSFVVLLMWVYYSALVCFYGAEFTQALARCSGTPIRPSRQAVRIGRKLGYWSA